MINNKLGKTKKSINEYNDSSGVSDTGMASIYDIPNMASEVTNGTLEEKNKSGVNKGSVRIINDSMASMYNMLRND